MPSERTVRDAADEARRSARAPREALHVVLCGERPLSGGLGVALAPADVVVIGRGAELALERVDGELWIRLPDARVSERHAVLERRGGALVLEDLGSTNGTFLAGEPITRAPLAPGASFSVGRTALVLERGLYEEGAVRAIAIPGAPLLTTLFPPLALAYERLAQAAPSALPVVLLGETGTGKEVAAQALHALSGRRGRFVAVNCAAIPEALFESELFGYRRGAFSGAQQDKIGLVAAAQGGTLLLDEVGELPLAAQAKLLRALQEREIVPLGAAEPVAVDFRLVCATNRDPSDLVQRGRFRADLWARLRGLELVLPRLAERRVDLGIIVAALLRAHGRGAPEAYRFERRVVEELVDHEWPLNVRELDRVIEALDEAPLGRPAPSARRDEDPEALRAELVAQLARHEGNISAIARAMRRTRMQVHRWLKRWNIDPASFRKRG